MFGDFGLTQPEKACRVVIENVTFLFCGKERSVLDAGDGSFNRLGPQHLIGAEHDSITEPCFDNRAQIPVELRLRQSIVNNAHINVDLRVRPENGEQIIQHGPPSVHDVYAKPWVSD